MTSLPGVAARVAHLGNVYTRPFILIVISFGWHVSESEGLDGLREDEVYE